MRIAVPAAIDDAVLSGWNSAAAVVDLRGDTMGTGWRVRLSPCSGLGLIALERGIAVLLDGIVGEMSHWQATSVLGRFNRAPAGNWTILPPAFASVMTAALDIAERSGGAFDPAIGTLVDAWGHGPEPRQEAPNQLHLRHARDAAGWRRLAFDQAASRLRQPGGLRLDLSGIAKGYAVDRLAGLLAEHGVGNALVEIGGEFAGRGLRPDGDPWWVDLETPDDVAEPLRVALHGLAVATSGDYIRGRHTIDPRSGRPVDHMLSVSVIHASAMLADAWATALGVLHPEEAMALAVREGLPARGLARSSDGVTEWISPALRDMIDG